MQSSVFNRCNYKVSYFNNIESEDLTALLLFILMVEENVEVQTVCESHMRGSMFLAGLCWAVCN